jgi:hypothetical protein
MKHANIFKAIITLLLIPFITTGSYGQESESEQGDLIYIISDNVSPSNYPDYEQWIKEFKAIADKTGAPSYSVSDNEEGMSFFMNIGKTMAGMDETNKKFGDWSTANPNIAELQKKYGHTSNYGKTSLWRHSPGQTYVPEGYDNSVARTYTRIGTNWIKTGMGKKFNEVIKEYIAEWTRAGITASTNTYWNVFGEEQGCVVFVTNYADMDAWMASRAEINEKVGEAKLKELNDKLMSTLRKQEQSESWSRPDLGHTQ